MAYIMSKQKAHSPKCWACGQPTEVDDTVLCKDCGRQTTTHLRDNKRNIIAKTIPLSPAGGIDDSASSSSGESGLA